MSVLEREDHLMRVLRFSDHADPMFCKCGHTWGHHGQLGKTFSVYKPLRPGKATLGDFTEHKNVTDCFGEGNNVCQCMRFVYDYDNPENMVVKVMSYWYEYA